MGALSINGIPALRTPFEPLVPEVRARAEHESLPPAAGRDGGGVHALPARRPRAHDRGDGPGDRGDGDHGAGAERRGAFTPPEGYWRGVRELCDRYGILLCADEVITGFGRVGAWFGSERYDIRPDLLTMAKGLSSAYAAIGAVVATDRVMEPFLDGGRCTRTASPSAGTRSGRDRAGDIEIMKREASSNMSRENEQHFRDTLAAAARAPDRRRPPRSRVLLRDRARQGQGDARDVPDDGARAATRLPLAALFERGLICRADDRGDPVIQISPPLVAGQDEFDQIVEILGEVLDEAWEKLSGEHVLTAS